MQKAALALQCSATQLSAPALQCRPPIPHNSVWAAKQLLPNSWNTAQTLIRGRREAGPSPGPIRPAEQHPKMVDY